MIVYKIKYSAGECGSCASDLSDAVREVSGRSTKYIRIYIMANEMIHRLDKNTVTFSYHLL